MVVYNYTYGLEMGYADSMIKEYDRYITHYKYTINKDKTKTSRAGAGIRF